MKPLILKLFFITTIITFVACQSEDDSISELPMDVQNFIEKNDLQLMEEGAPTVASFNSIEEAENFLNQITLKSLHLENDLEIIPYKFGETKTYQKNSTPIVRSNTIGIIIESYVLSIPGTDINLPAFKLVGDLSYRFCTGNGNFVNDEPYIFDVRIEGFSAGINWIPSPVTSARYETPTLIRYSVVGTIRVGLNFRGFPVSRDIGIGKRNQSLGTYIHYQEINNSGNCNDNSDDNDPGNEGDHDACPIGDTDPV